MMSLSTMTATTPTTTTTSTTTAWIALLQEDDLNLRLPALQNLLASIDTCWHLVAERLPDLESMAEDAELPLSHCQTAAAVASRVYFHLQEPNQALAMALKAGLDHLDDAASPYAQRLVAAAIDAYCQAKQQRNEQEQQVDLPQLQQMVYNLMNAACQTGNDKQALGIALEAQETDWLVHVLSFSKSLDLCKYAWHAACHVVSSKPFRMQALQVVADQLLGLSNIHQTANDLVIVYQLLSQAESVAAVLLQLLNNSQEPDDPLLGLQLCFDLTDSGDQAFVQSVAQHLEGESSDMLSKARQVLVGGFSSELALGFLYKESHADGFIMEQLKKSLEERSSGSRSSVLHNAACVCHGYLYAGTTNDAFLRNHLDWMKKASNWAKFSATASLGVVHAGHVTEAMHLLEPYLPTDPDQGQEVSPTGGYAEGGSLYALGLIFGSTAQAGQKQTNDFLRKHLRASHANEVTSHGAALGVGLTAQGAADLEIVTELKELLDTDSAVAGEAAGIAIGLVLVGTGAGNTHNSLTSHQNELAEVVAELKNYARETQHEKIIRGIAMGLALMNFGQEENADAVISEMRSDRDPIMRYGSMYALALAYCGTGSNKAIRILLHTAVSDVSDDVRMAAVIGLAFVLFKTPERVPQLVKLLLESFNPHVRYASCMAVGIAMAGTGHAESIAMLEPIQDDMTDYVRQGALMGTAMIYMQQSDVCNGRRIKSFREKLATIVTEKHQSTLTKMGAILSTGIIDAGGRNCSLALGSRFGFTKMSSAVGLALWLQHWHWFPMMHMLSLALTPQYTVGLNRDFKYPKKFEIQCNAKPSLFNYPRPLEEKKEEKKKRVETVTLSTTAKEKARLARKRAKLGLDMEVVKEEPEEKAAEEMKIDDKPKTEDAMQVDDKKTNAMQVDEEDDKKTAQEDKTKEEKKPKKKREPESFRVGNPARITQAQSLVCTFDLNQRYRPIRPDEKPLGVIMLTDSTPDCPDQDLGAVKSPSDEPQGELPPPEPFVWTPADKSPTSSSQD